METRLFPKGSIPDFTTREWYEQRARAPHLEQEGHRDRIMLAAEFVNEAIVGYGYKTVSDMGCGDGGLLTLIRGAESCWGYDLQPSNARAGQLLRRVDVRLGDIESPEAEWGDLAVCTEVLEHLPDPHSFVAAIPCRAIVCSSPATETLEDHYEFHAWAWDIAGYDALFEQAGFDVVRHELAGMFQVVLAVRP